MWPDSFPSTRSLRTLGLGSGRLSQQDIFDILRNTRRRYAFHYVLSCDGPVSLGTLADHVAAWENDKAVDEIEAEERQRAYVSLRQSHLPKMDDAGVVSFDSSANTVELAGNAADVEVYLEEVPEGDILWAQTYLGIAGFGAALLVPVWLNVSPFADQAAPIGLAVMLAFAGSALLHHRHLQRRRLGTGEVPV